MRTALIVEDEPEANNLLAMLVRLKGYQTVSAYNGREALAQIRSQPPDIVFLDLMLPDIDGYEVCRAVKTDPATSLVPIVMVTARIASDNRSLGYKAGADEYIPKPYTPDQIFHAMSEADDWRRAIESESVEIDLPTEDLESFARLRARIRSLLVARTAFSTAELDGIDQALKSFQAWFQAEHEREPFHARLAYQVQPDRFTIVIRGLSGSDRLQGLLADPEARRSILTATGFDQAERDETRDVLLLVRYAR